ncbi:hypothetical protein ELF90_06695, partial [Neisseria gonorrhoeae]
PQTVQIVRQGEATPDRFKFNPLYSPSNIPDTKIRNAQTNPQYHPVPPGDRT